MVEGGSVSGAEATAEADKRLLDLFCYMVTSARGCVNEPTIYGPFRLVDTMQKVIEILEELDLASKFLSDQRMFIAEKKLLMVDDVEAFVGFLDVLVLRFATELKQN